MQKDDLCLWVRRHRNDAFYSRPSAAVQAALGRIVDYVDQHTIYQRRRKQAFSGKADPWIIAQALAEGGRVVTWESRVGDNSTKVKIPNVCEHFGIQTLNIWGLYT
jgi:hypothetical protein